MDMLLQDWPSLAGSIALVLASGVALAWAMRHDTLPRAALRWVAPPVVAMGCIALWRDWPRGWAIAPCLLALPLLIAAQVLVAAIASPCFATGPTGTTTRPQWRTERLPGLRMERQGVRPLSGALAGPTTADADRAALALDRLPAPEAPATGVMREVHHHYWSANGVLRQGVEPAHRAFFAWLDQAPQG